jgi:DNA-binding transcriptional regulator YiaG
MTKHAGEEATSKKVGLRVLDRQRRSTTVEKTTRKTILPVYDATVFVGLRTMVYEAAIERIENDGEHTIELPKMNELVAAASVARCLMPVKLRGAEIKAMRRIMKMTLADLAAKLDGKTAPETVSRWESEAQPMGGYAEKVFRLLVCEELKDVAPGIDYNASILAHLIVRDPWKVDPNYQMPAVDLRLIQLKRQPSGSITEAWNTKIAA